MKKINYLLLFFAAFLISCSGNTDTKEKTNKVSRNFEKQQTVCIWDGVPVREEPSKDGKWLSKISLGESLFFLGETAVDSTDNNREYIKVELSDGKIAWASSYGLVIDGSVAAVKEKVPVYERPDLLTLTKKEFKEMDILAIEEVKEDWIKVIGQKKKIKGWIKKSVVTENKEDIAVAILASKLLMKDGEIVPEKIEEFLESLPYKNSFFNQYIKSQIIEEEVVIEESVEEVELEEVSEEVETEEITEE
jgi:hypothetical protein